LESCISAVLPAGKTCTQAAVDAALATADCMAVSTCTATN
jgi:hypothetical protein